MIVDSCQRMKSASLAFIILSLVTSAPSTLAMSKKEFIDWGIANLHDVTHPTRAGKQARREWLSVSNQCLFGFTTDSAATVNSISNYAMGGIGLKMGDELISLNDVNANSIEAASPSPYLDWVSQIPLTEGQVVNFLYSRQGETLSSRATCEVSKNDYLNFLSPVAASIFKDKPEACVRRLEQVEFRADSYFAEQHMAIAGVCLTRWIAKKRNIQKQYNHANHLLFSRSLDYWDLRYSLGGISRDGFLELTSQTILPTIEFLKKTNSADLAISLSKKLDESISKLGPSEAEVRRAEVRRQQIEKALTSVEDYWKKYLPSTEIPELLSSALANPVATRGRFESAEEFKARAAIKASGRAIEVFAQRPIDSGYYLNESETILLPFWINEVELAKNVETEVIEGQNGYGNWCEQKIRTVTHYKADLKNRPATVTGLQPIERVDSKELVPLPRSILYALNPELIEVVILEVNLNDPSKISGETNVVDATCNQSGFVFNDLNIEAKLRYQAIVDGESNRVLAVVSDDGTSIFSPISGSYADVLGVKVQSSFGGVNGAEQMSFK